MDRRRLWGRRRDRVDRARPEPTGACRAPSVSMYLDQLGEVRACCMNTRHPLGNIADAGLLALWRGEPAQALRDALARHDLSSGCELCAMWVDEGRPDLAFARDFDRFEPDETTPIWPRQIEVSISNTCNLQCVMCNGDWSSAIRSRREGRPPLPSPYDERFHTDLDEFLPHLTNLKLLGGEPFLSGDTLRIMDRLVERDLRPTCHVTTNGTQWTPRVERILDRLPVDVAVSLDAATPDTYRSIRVGAEWHQVMGNVQRFLTHAARAGRTVSLTYCLMPLNWHELGRFCRLGDDLGVDVMVNLVTHPVEHSLYHLEVDELAAVVAALEREDAHLRLTRNAAVWAGELDKVRARLADARAEADGTAGGPPLKVRLGLEPPAPPDSPDDAAERLAWRQAHLPAHPATLTLSPEGRVTGWEPGGLLATVDAGTLLGAPYGGLTDLFVEALPALGKLGEARLVADGHGCQAYRVPVTGLDGLDGLDELAVLVEPVRDPGGRIVATTVTIGTPAAGAR